MGWVEWGIGAVIFLAFAAVLYFLGRTPPAEQGDSNHCHGDHCGKCRAPGPSPDGPGPGSEKRSVPGGGNPPPD